MAVRAGAARFRLDLGRPERSSPTHPGKATVSPAVGTAALDGLDFVVAISTAQQPFHERLATI